VGKKNEILFMIEGGTGRIFDVKKDGFRKFCFDIMDAFCEDLKKLSPSELKRLGIEKPNA
jgi:hypothetical protein